MEGSVKESEARDAQPARQEGAPLEDDRIAAWGYAARQGEPRYQGELALILAIILYATLPQKLVLGPGAIGRWWLPALEVSLVVPLWISEPYRNERESAIQRSLAIALIAIISIANLASLTLLIHELLFGRHVVGRTLILSSIQVWVTNVLVFGLWYWELDRGGPAKRKSLNHRNPDFLFPQMTTPASAPRGWHPTCIDYIYVSFTNATAFSPTDTLPLTVTAKLLMLVQSMASLVTVALVAARAVNILS
jgi:uncharacterized membrane protein